MADVVDEATRSRMMRGIRGKNTKPELIVRRMLHAAGFRYRLHVRKLPGTPDMVLKKHRAAIFVSGCFWHGHDCGFFKLPKTRTEFWRNKIGRNRANDRRTEVALQQLGWRQATIWECALRGVPPERLQRTGEALATWLRSRRRLWSVRGKR